MEESLVGERNQAHKKLTTWRGVLERGRRSSFKSRRMGFKRIPQFYARWGREKRLRQVLPPG
jgi:hypothetical protein